MKESHQQVDHGPDPLVRSRLRRTIATTAIAAMWALSGCVGTTADQVNTSGSTTTGPPSTTAPVPDCAETLPASAQAGQMLMVMVTTPAQATDVLGNGTAGGLGLKGRQPKDIGDGIAAAVGSAPIIPFVASDEEGGSVQRLTAALGELPSAQDMSEGTPDEAAAKFSRYAGRMKDLGFNMVFGPVADVGEGSGLGTRSFGDDPKVVADFVTSIIKAEQDAGLIAVVKHWPGIGGGRSDPHDRLDSLPPLTELRARDMVPFKAAFHVGVGAVMVSHSVVPGLTGPDEPASLSTAAITGELRGTGGYKGLVITDSLGMGSIVSSMTQEVAAEKAITAGADIALLSGADAVPLAHSRLTEAITSGRIPASRVIDSVRRVLAAKGISGECPDLVATTTATSQDLTREQSETPGSDQSTDEIDNGADPQKSTGRRDTGINDADINDAG